MNLNSWEKTSMVETAPLLDVETYFALLLPLMSLFRCHKKKAKFIAISLDLAQLI